MARYPGVNNAHYSLFNLANRRLPDIRAAQFLIMNLPAPSDFKKLKIGPCSFRPIHLSCLCLGNCVGVYSTIFDLFKHATISPLCTLVMVPSEVQPLLMTLNSCTWDSSLQILATFFRAAWLLCFLVVNLLLARDSLVGRC